MRATTTATRAIIPSTLGPAVVHSAEALRRPGAETQVGDQVDRAGDDHGALRTGQLARAGERRARRRARSRRPRRAARRARPAWPAGSARGLGAAVQTNVAQRGSSARSIARRVLVVEDRHDADERALGQRRGQRLDAARVVRAVEDRQRPLADDLQPPGHGDPRGDARDHGRRRARRGARAPPRRRRRSSCAGSPGSARRDGLRPHDPRAGRARERLDLRVGVARARASASGAHDRELLARDVGDRRPEPAGVLEPDVGQHDDRRAQHAGRVVAPAEAGLDDRDLDPAPRQLVERRGGDQLELGHAVARLQPAVDLRGRRRRRAARRRRTRPARGRGRRSGCARRTSVRCGERNAPARTPCASSSAAVMRTVELLPFVPTTWIAREALLRRAERGEQPAHPLQAEAHAEQLEAEQVLLGALGAPRSQPVALLAQPRRACRARPRRRPSGALATKPSLASFFSARAISASSQPRRSSIRRAAAPRSTASDGSTATAPPGTATVAAGSPPSGDHVAARASRATWSAVRS